MYSFFDKNQHIRGQFLQKNKDTAPGILIFLFTVIITDLYLILQPTSVFVHRLLFEQKRDIHQLQGLR
jgi:hypothetical protein